MTFIDQLKENKKAWEEFERWYWEANLYGLPHKVSVASIITDFTYLPFEMQSGVFIAFLDSRGVIANSNPVIFSGDKEIMYWVPVIEKTTVDYKPKFYDRNESLQSAILKSFQILENQLTL